jgi:hypothetical protein
MIAALVPRTLAEVEHLQAVYPNEFRNGYRFAFLGKTDSPRDKGGYPLGFHTWPLDKRNAWWAGANRGLCDRASIAEAVGSE